MYASKGTMFDRLREQGLAGWHLLPADEREELAECIEGVRAAFVVEPVDGLEWPDQIPLPGFPGQEQLCQPWLLPYDVCWWEFAAVNTSIEETTRCGVLAGQVKSDTLHRSGQALDIPAGLHLLTLAAFWETRDHIVYTRRKMMSIVDENGAMPDKFMYHGKAPDEASDFHQKNIGWMGAYCARSVHQALALMECKNVEVIRHTAEPRLMKSKKQRRKNEGLPPRYDYHTLRITSGKRIVYDGPGSTDPAMLKAQHLCRGHFKTYTDDAPLFGKFTGRYWWPPHVRGSLEVGLVEKDYEVTR